MPDLKKEQVMMLTLLLLVALAVRMVYAHPTDFDSYWLHGMSESIDVYGYAKWVYHPVSLFGYYPLSYPSALMFFLAFFSKITGLSMDLSVMSTGIFLGLFGTVVCFLLGRKIGGFFVGFFSAFIFALSPQIINYSTYVASGRYLLIVLYMVFLIFLIEILNYSLYKIESASSDIKASGIGGFSPLKSSLPKLLFAAAALLVFMFMTHRTSQLSVLFILAAIATFLYYWIPSVMEKLKKNRHIDKLFFERYQSWNKWILIDAFAVFLVLFLLKFIDLVSRGRLLINIQRKLPALGSLIDKTIGIISANKVISIFLIIVVVDLIIAAIIYLRKYKDKKIMKAVISKADVHYSRFHSNLLEDPKKYFFRALLIAAVLMFFLQFFGKSFYSPSLKEYTESDLFEESKNPAIIFLNFTFNYFTSVSIFSAFAGVGFFILFLKNEKSYLDVFLMLLTTAFIGILIDKNYVRLFVTPIIAVLSAYGIYQLFRIFRDKLGRKTVFAIFLILILSGASAAFIPQLREKFRGRVSTFDFEYPYWNTGIYIGSLDCKCSTITTEEQVAGVTVFASSRVPGGTHNVYYFVNQTFLAPDPISFSYVFEKITSGVKVDQLWYLPDWILGGQYYVGRHAINLFERSYNNPISSRILKDYKEYYYIHDKKKEQPVFYRSIVPIKNKVYDNSLANVYDLNKGRDS